MYPFLLALFACLLLTACKSENANNTTNNSTSTTNTTSTTPAAPAPAALAAKLEKLPDLALPITVMPSGNKQFKKLDFEDIDWLQKDFNVQFESNTMDMPTGAFRATLSSTRQLVGILYTCEPMGGRQDTNLILMLLDNSGNAIGNSINVSVAASLFNAYNAASTDGTVIIETAQILTASTTTIMDPNGEKDDEITKIPPTAVFRIGENGFLTVQ